MKDWQAWARDHKHPKAAARVLAWLEDGDHEEPTWQAADDLVELVVSVQKGVPMNYGECEGGPWHGKNLAHHEPVCDVPVEIYSRKIRVGVQRGTPGYEHGEYTWKDGKWHWNSPAAVSSRGSSPSQSHPPSSGTKV